MSVINIDFSPEAKSAKNQAISELVYQQWKSNKRLELILRDNMDNIEELFMQIALQPSSDFFQDVQIISPEQAEKEEQDKKINILESA